MKKYFLFLFVPLFAFADNCRLEQFGAGDWRIVCEGSGLEINYVDVTNEVYIIGNCESVKSNLLEEANYTFLRMYSTKDSVENLMNCVSQLDPDMNGNVVWSSLKSNAKSALIGIYSSLDHIQSVAGDIFEISCETCPTNGSSGGGSGGSCCDSVDLSSIIQRMIAAEQQRVAISNQVASILSGLGVLTNALYSSDDDLVTNEKTWLYNFYLNSWQSRFNYFPDEEPYSISSILLNSSYSLVTGVSSLNNFMHGVAQPSFTALQSPSALLYFDSSVEERDYYTYLTNYYFGMVRKDSEIPSNYRTNWFARIETLLAALVFQDGAKTNYYESSQSSISNSFQQVYDDFEYRMSGISDFSTEQIRLVSTVERSMYNNLRAFSRAFSDASLPSSVQIINVHKDAGSRSLSSDTVDVTVDVDGKLLDFIEIIRSASTLCWVFLGLWMMFKFSVWTVKKIYVLIRYIIDFFNMVVGGK